MSQGVELSPPDDENRKQIEKSRKDGEMRHCKVMVSALTVRREGLIWLRCRYDDRWGFPPTAGRSRLRPFTSLEERHPFIVGQYFIVMVGVESATTLWPHLTPPDLLASPRIDERLSMQRLSLRSCRCVYGPVWSLRSVLLGFYRTSLSIPVQFEFSR